MMDMRLTSSSGRQQIDFPHDATAAEVLSWVIKRDLSSSITNSAKPRSFSGKQDVAKNYRGLFASMRNVRFQLLQRFATEDRVVDDSMVTFEVARAGYWPWPVGAKIEMRLVHIFEMRDEKISRELVFDMGRPVR